MTSRLNLNDFRIALKEQNSMIFENAAHTQFKVTIPCPECGQVTSWVEGEKSDLYRMQPCAHEVPSDARRIEVDEDGYLRVKDAPEA